MRMYQEKINNSVLTFDKRIFVCATKGNDITGIGSQGNPYKSINKAVSMIKSTNTVIHINDGEYNEIIDTNNALFISKDNHSVTFIGSKAVKVNVAISTVNKSVFSLEKGSVTVIGFNIYINAIIDNTYLFNVDNSISGKIMNIHNCSILYKPSTYIKAIVNANNYGTLNVINSFIDFVDPDNVYGITNVNAPNVTVKFDNTVINGIENWNCIGNIANKVSWSLNYCVVNSTIGLTESAKYILNAIIEKYTIYDKSDFMIIDKDIDWINKGNPVIKNSDNTKSHIGVYGGIYSWSPSFYYVPEIKFPKMINFIEKDDSSNVSFSIESPYIQFGKEELECNFDAQYDSSSSTYPMTIDVDMWKKINFIDNNC